MRLPLFTPREEAVPTRATRRVPLPRSVALVSLGDEAALTAHLDAMTADVVLYVTEGVFALDEARRRASVDEASAVRLRDALAGRSAVLVGAIVPALFVPTMAIGFANGQSPAAYPAAGRSVRDLLDGTLSSARPALARNVSETCLARP